MWARLHSHLLLSAGCPSLPVAQDGAIEGSRPGPLECTIQKEGLLNKETPLQRAMVLLQDVKPGESLKKSAKEPITHARRLCIVVILQDLPKNSYSFSKGKPAMNVCHSASTAGL